MRDGSHVGHSGSGAGSSRGVAGPVTIDHQFPAPTTATSSTTMWRVTLNVPFGIQTTPERRFANAIAASNAAEESRAPVGSAPNSVTGTAFAGFVFGLATSSVSSRSITVQSAAAPAGTASRIVSPVWNVFPSRSRCSS